MVGGNDDLSRGSFVAKDVNWISIAGVVPGAPARAQVKIRNRHTAAATIDVPEMNPR